METFFLTILFVFWLLFWSFASVIIYRIKSWEWWILTWRSHCGSCNKLLKAIDLIPLFSWIFNRWKCRQCKSKVSWLYPLLEVSTWILFSLVWFFLIDFNLIQNFNIWEIIKLFFWLIISFISIIYIFYDILFLEISERVLATWVGIALFWVILQWFFWINLIPSLPKHFIEINNYWIYFSILLIIWIIGWLYTIILKWLSEIWDIVILLWLWALIYIFSLFFNNILEYTAISSIIWILSIFTFFFIQIVISWWKWMWWWDLRIAIMVWLMLGSTLAFPAMMLTYFVWSFIWIFFILYQKIKNKKNKELDTQIPFWPFIAIWFFLAIFFQEYIIHFIDSYLFI